MRSLVSVTRAYGRRVATLSSFERYPENKPEQTAHMRILYGKLLGVNLLSIYRIYMLALAFL
jgi:hypothetical protein